MTRSTSDTEYRAVSSTNSSDDFPRIDYDMRQHKVGIIITWTILFISSAVSPNVLYFALRYAAHLDLSITLGVTSAVFGVFSVFSLVKRTYYLLRPSSTCRPLGASRKAMDYFNINFMVAFVFTTVIIVVGNVITNIRVIALGLPVIVTAVCFEMLVVGLASSFHKRAPFRMSSVPKGEMIRSGVYILAEDIIAVDAGQGQAFRRQLKNRYEASRTVKAICHEMDLIWGSLGTVVGIGAIVALFVVPNENVAFILGWTIPWAFAAVMALFTFIYCMARLQHEVLDEQWSKQHMLN